MVMTQCSPSKIRACVCTFMSRSTAQSKFERSTFTLTLSLTLTTAPNMVVVPVVLCFVRRFAAPPLSIRSSAYLNFVVKKCVCVCVCVGIQ